MVRYPLALDKEVHRCQPGPYPKYPGVVSMHAGIVSANNHLHPRRFGTDGIVVAHHEPQHARNAHRWSDQGSREGGDCLPNQKEEGDEEANRKAIIVAVTRSGCGQGVWFVERGCGCNEGHEGAYEY